RLLRAFAVLVRRRLQPVLRARGCAIGLAAVEINHRKVVLRLGMAELGGTAKPSRGIGHAAQHAFAAGIKLPDAIERLGMPALASRGPGAQRLEMAAAFVFGKPALVQSFAVAPPDRKPLQ